MRENEPAFPQPNEQRYNDPIFGVIRPSDIYGPNESPGFTKRELACIHLKVPATGDPELDAIIRKAREAAFAGLAMQGLVGNPMSGSTESIARVAVDAARALIAELEKQK